MSRAQLSGTDADGACGPSEPTRPVAYPVLSDPGLRPLTPDWSFWDAEQRMDRLGGWMKRRLGEEGYRRLVIAARHWWGSRGLRGPVPRHSPLATLAGTTSSDEAANPFRLSRGALLGRQQERRSAARDSLTARPVDGWCHRGHQLTPENRSGRNCRICRNATYRAKRKGITIEAELHASQERAA